MESHQEPQLPLTSNNFKSRKKFNIFIIMLLILILLLVIFSFYLYYQNKLLATKVISEPSAKLPTSVTPLPTALPTTLPDTRLYARFCSGPFIRLPDPREPGWKVYIDQDCEFFIKMPESYSFGSVWYNNKTDGSAGLFQYIHEQGFDNTFNLEPKQELERDKYLTPPTRLIKSMNLNLNGNQAIEILVENMFENGLPTEGKACQRFIVVKRVPRFYGQESYLEFDEPVSDNRPNNCLEYLETRQKNIFDQIINTLEFLDQFETVG